MSSRGYSAAPPPRQGGHRFYNPPAVRRHQQILVQQLLLQQQQNQHHQQLQQQQQRTLQRRVMTESSSSAGSEKQSDSDDSSMAAALSLPPSVCPASTLKTTNLDRFMESVTPFVEARYLSEENARALSRTREVDSHAFFYLEDLWESFGEWSVYGVEVPLLLNGSEPIEQYYVPFLSGIQLYVDPSKPSSRVRGFTEDIDVDAYRSTSSDYEGDKRANYVWDLNLQGLSRLSIGDDISAFSSTSSEANIDNSPRLPLFQFMEHEQPYNRRPLTDKMSSLAFQYPELNKCRSCDLLPTSWICVAWYPIYRIPLGSTLQDLDASFLTFHSLSTQSKSACAANTGKVCACAANTGKVCAHADDPTWKIPLPVFALASYKLKGSIVSPCGPHECEQEDSLLQAADNWLRHLQVMLPDYHFFRAHYSRGR